MNNTEFKFLIISKV